MAPAFTDGWDTATVDSWDFCASLQFWEQLEKDAKALGLPDRCLYALSDAAQGLKVRNATYRTIAEISEQVASRDLKALVESGLLLAHGMKRGRFYSASEALVKRQRQAQVPRRSDDPYE